MPSADSTQTSKILKPSSVPEKLPYYGVATQHGIPIYSVSGGRTHGGTQVSETSVFRIASLTKVVTSMAVMRMIETGALEFETTIGDLVRSFPELNFDYPAMGADVKHHPPEEITIRQLLNQTSGLAYDFTSPDAVRQQLLALGKTGCRLYPPGTRWHYGPGLEWLGRALEALSNDTLDNVLARIVLNPLGMTQTTYSVPQDSRDRIVDVFKESCSGFELHPVRSSWVSSKPSGDGGLFSTPVDMLKLAQSYCDGSVPISEHSLQLMLSNQIEERPLYRQLSSRPDFSASFDFMHSQDRFGYGFVVSGPRAQIVPFGAAIWGGSYNCFLWVDRRSSLCGVYLTQVLPFCSPKTMAVIQRFVSDVYACAA